MKKFLVILLAAVLVLGVFTACGGGTQEETTTTETTTTEPETEAYVETRPAAKEEGKLVYDENGIKIYIEKEFEYSDGFKGAFVYMNVFNNSEEEIRVIPGDTIKVNGEYVLNQLYMGSIKPGTSVRDKMAPHSNTKEIDWKNVTSLEMSVIIFGPDNAWSKETEKFDLFE